MMIAKKSIKRIDSLSINNLHHEFQDKVIDIEGNIEINNSGLYYITGNSGAGKSTLVKLLCKIYKNNETCKIQINHTDINDFNEKNFLTRVTYIDGAPEIFNGTISENIYINGLTPNSVDFSQYFDEKENMDFNKYLDTSDTIPLSLGQIQRINILRLIVKNRKEPQLLVVLDEALSGIDEERETQLVNLIKEEMKTAIVFIISHRSSVRKYCDYELEVKGNKINFSPIK